MKFNIVTYIKPNHNFEMFAKCLASIQESIYLNKICISFVENLSSEFVKELEKYDNIIWKDGVDKYWANEINTLIKSNPADYYYTWEEDSDIYNIKQFDKAFKGLVKKEIDYMLTLDLKWIERANFLLSNNLAIKEGEFIYFNWGTYYAKYCRENSSNKLVKGAYPVSIGGIFSKSLLTSLLDMLTQSQYWKDITAGNFNHFHNNPKLPHSFEVFPGFWWEGKNNGYGNIEYSAMVSTIQYAEELGGRLIDKLQQPQDTVNIVGYDGWYLESPWHRSGTNIKFFNAAYNKSDANITYFIKDGIFEIKNGYNSNINVALLTECRLLDPKRHAFLEENSELFDYFVTYDDQLIKNFKNKAIITPYGGSWIHPSMQKIYNKTKLCSYITSKKTYTKDQSKRVNLLEYFYKNKSNNIELFGRDHNPIPEIHTKGNIDGKILALKDFAFSIVIENHRQDNYFSEKLLDCFLTGTIPIYYGCKDIKKYFNSNGIVLLNDIDDAKSIVLNLTYKKYDLMLDAIKENFNLAKQYIDSLSYSYKIIKQKECYDTKKV